LPSIGNAVKAIEADSEAITAINGRHKSLGRADRRLRLSWRSNLIPRPAVGARMGAKLSARIRLPTRITISLLARGPCLDRVASKSRSLNVESITG